MMINMPASEAMIPLDFNSLVEFDLNDNITNEMNDDPFYAGQAGEVGFQVINQLNNFADSLSKIEDDENYSVKALELYA